MKRIGILGGRLDRLTPWNDKLHAYFDDEPGTKQLEGLGILCKTVSSNPGSIAAGAEGTASVTVAGLTPQHKIFATLKSDVTVGLYLRGARCTTAGTLILDYANHSAGAIDEAAHSVELLAIPGDLN